MEIQFLTSEHIYLIHEDQIQKYGGQEGHYNFTSDRIESILAQQYPCFEVDKYPDIFQKAAMLMYFFIKGHCFIDGNKRLGIQSAIIFLMLNGYEDHLDDDEGYQKVMEIASLELPELKRDQYLLDLAHWLSERFY